MFHVHSPSQPSENVLDVGVVSPRLGYGDAQLGVAQRPDGGDDARDDPDEQRHAHRAGVLHHSLRTDEDARADDVACWRADQDTGCYQVFKGVKERFRSIPLFSHVEVSIVHMGSKTSQVICLRQGLKVLISYWGK